MYTVRAGIWREIRKLEKLDAHTGVPGIWQENWKMWKMRMTHGRIGNIGTNTEKRGKLKMHTVGPGFGEKTKKHGK